ncbi:hypothetical protein AB0N06_35745, partial [Streptomyces sp. NPDC051020]
PPEVLLHHIERDLVAHTGGDLGDDVALIAIRRAPTGHSAQRRGRDCPREAERAAKKTPARKTKAKRPAAEKTAKRDAARQAG